MPLKDLEARKEYKRKWYQKYKVKNPDAGKKTWLKLKANPKKHKEDNKRRKEIYHNPNMDRKMKTKEYYQKNYRLRKYGLTVEDWQKMFDEQQGCCAICGRHQSEFKITFSTDHNHITGKVRKLLCVRCNSILGQCKDNIEILEAAIKYLVENG